MAKTNKNEADNGYQLVFCTRFWHKRAKRWIYAQPGRVFCLKIRRRAA